MGKVSASNAVVSAIESAAAIYGVRSYRMNSRTFMVPGAGGRERPMFMGQWKDENGETHRQGMADLLLTPRIPVVTATVGRVLMSVPLWVECKSGSGKLEPEQKLFRDDVTKAGAFYIEAHDSAQAVIDWFTIFGVSR
jgi:hypothetical protein